MNLLTQVFRSYWLASVHNSQISSLQMEGFTEQLISSWLAGLFGLTAWMLKKISSWVRDRSDQVHLDQLHLKIYSILFRHSYNHSRKTSSQELLMFKIIAKHTHTVKDWVLKKTHILKTIYTSVLPLFLQQEDLEMIDHSNFHHHHHHHDRNYSINWGGKTKTKQNKTNLRQFWKNFCHNFTMCNRVGHSTPMGGTIHSFLHHTLFSPNSLLWHSMLVVGSAGYRVRTSVWVNTRLEPWPIYRSGQARPS